MATEEKKSYPMMAVKNWFALRKKFKISIPKEVTANYLSSALGMSTLSAQKNILPYLRLTGLIDQDGKTTDKAIKWRDDNQYPEVCESVRKEVYPQELLDLAPPTDLDRNSVQTWFANNTGGGISQAGKQAAFYMMLCEADLGKENEVKTQPAKPKIAKTNLPKKTTERNTTAKQDTTTQSEIPLHIASHKKPFGSSEIVPQFHFNIQIVLPENASQDTYENIFKSIATYLLNRHEE